MPIVDLRPAELPALVDKVKPPVTFVVVGHDELVDELVAEHPDAEVETHRDPEDKVVFVSVTVEG